MGSDEISYVIRCVAVTLLLLGLAGVVFTYNVLLETPQFVQLLKLVGLN